MLKALVITHRLDMALRLVDTTSGRNLSGTGVETFIDGRRAWFLEKEDGILIFQGLSSRKFVLQIRSRSFENTDIDVDLDALDQSFPLLEVHMVPGEKFPGTTRFLTLKGHLEGIRELSAVKTGNKACMIREFDARKRLAQISNPYRLMLDRVCYAVVNPETGRFQPVRIVKVLNNETIKLDCALQEDCRNFFPICPAVFGHTRPDGSYCLRVRDDGEKAEWIVRWVVGEDVFFKTIDFRTEEMPEL